MVGTRLEGEHPVEDDQVEAGPVEVREHEVNLDVVDINLLGAVGLSDGVALEMLLPLRMARIRTGFRDANGELVPGFRSIHHRNETLFGPGDLQLTSRFRLVKPTLAHSWAFDLYGGLTLPTGNTEPNPFELGRQGLRHQHIFFGSGTVDPVFGFNLTRGFGDASVGLWLNARTPFADNRHDYRRGATVTTGIDATHSFGLEKWVFSIGPEIFHEQQSTWEEGREPARNTGRTDLLAKVAVVYRPSSRVTLDLGLKKPFTLRVNGGQVDIPFVATVGAVFSFSAWGSDDEGDDGHDHGDDGHDHHGHGHDHHGHGGPGHASPGHHDHGTEEGDVQDLATGGATFDLDDAIVPGKITVIDFWATWCHPCIHIDAMLKKLARDHPNLAVRRVEVIDSDSPVVVDHLRNAGGLPVLWIFDAQGRRVRALETTTAGAAMRVLQRMLDTQ